MTHKNARDKFAFETIGVATGILIQLMFFIYLFGFWAGPLAFAAFSFVSLLYLNLMFYSNHHNMPLYTVSDFKAMPFPELAIRTTRNYGHGFFSRFFCGGLEHQIEHHLFPTIPRRNLIKVSPLVQEYCKRTGLPYEQEGIFTAIKKTVDFHVRR